VLFIRPLKPIQELRPAAGSIVTVGIAVVIGTLAVVVTARRANSVIVMGSIFISIGNAVVITARCVAAPNRATLVT
jgi:hypothetical protein